MRGYCVFHFGKGHGIILDRNCAVGGDRCLGGLLGTLRSKTVSKSACFAVITGTSIIYARGYSDELPTACTRLRCASSRLRDGPRTVLNTR